MQPLAPGTWLVGNPGRATVSGLERWAAALVAAWSIRDAVVIAAVRFEQQLASGPTPQLYMYRVEALPFHTGPLAVIEELHRRDLPHEELIREYWAPSGGWHTYEVLTSSLVVVEEVALLRKQEIYVPLWVLYRQDAERARKL
jgi:hypothetical protein